MRASKQLYVILLSFYLLFPEEILTGLLKPKIEVKYPIVKVRRPKKIFIPIPIVIKVPSKKKARQRRLKKKVTAAATALVAAVVVKKLISKHLPTLSINLGKSVQVDSHHDDHDHYEEDHHDDHHHDDHHHDDHHDHHESRYHEQYEKNIPTASSSDYPDGPEPDSHHPDGRRGSSSSIEEIKLGQTHSSTEKYGSISHNSTTMGMPRNETRSH